MSTHRPILILLVLLGVTVEAKTPLEFLREAPPPHFHTGHTLPPLTRWGWSMEFDVRVELCERWGYALEFGDDASAEHVKQLDDPKSEAGRICALTASTSRVKKLSS